MTPTTVSLRGRAEIVQGGNRIRANAIEATLGGSGVSRIEATGDVYFVTPDQSMRGERAVYTPGNDEIVVTGDVVLTQGRNVLTGNRVVYNTRTETARIEGGGGNGRVQGVFYPEGDN
jgi:lipopolysaccharide export system protein LptA